MTRNTDRSFAWLRRSRAAARGRTRELLAAGALVAAATAVLMAQAGTKVGTEVVGTASPGQPPAVSCESLTGQALANVKVTSAMTLAAGAFTPPAPPQGQAPAAVQLPAHCAVMATLTPASDSDIKMALWLPTEGWNGKFLMVGNGGWGGSIEYAAMAEPLGRGYAVASTDTGHEGTQGTFAAGHPEKLIDFAYRAVHETALAAKALTTAYYKGSPRFSYWDGCSAGGRQGLKEAQMYPADFDGVIAGAPASDWIGLQAQSLAANRANRPRNGAPILGGPQLKLLHEAVLNACDANDRVKDNQIQDPRTCAFQASSLICKAGQDPATCLTPAQAKAADAIYAPAVDPGTRSVIAPGMPPGSELTWGAVVGQPWTIGIETFALATKNPRWNPSTLDLGRDVAAAKASPVGAIDAANPDLSAFKARGGKIVQYHGWADPLNPTEGSINYYEKVVAAQGGMAQTRDFYRLFLVPAMGHCGGAYVFDWIRTLDQWVEVGQEPDVVLGDHIPPPGVTPAPPPPGAVVFAPEYGVRPTCAYPDIAVYQGGGGRGGGPAAGRGAGEQPLDWLCEAGPRGARMDQR
jgi:feruloyl esterase